MMGLQLFPGQGTLVRRRVCLKCRLRFCLRTKTWWHKFFKKTQSREGMSFTEVLMMDSRIMYYLPFSSREGVFDRVLKMDQVIVQFELMIKVKLMCQAMNGQRKCGRNLKLW